jgi:excisionase family DNA binding protein
MNQQKETINLPRLLYTVSEAAAMLSVSEKTIYRLINRGYLKAPSELRHKKITAASIKAFAEAVG